MSSSALTRIATRIALNSLLTATIALEMRQIVSLNQIKNESQSKKMDNFQINWQSDGRFKKKRKDSCFSPIACPSGHKTFAEIIITQTLPSIKMYLHKAHPWFQSSQYSLFRGSYTKQSKENQFFSVSLAKGIAVKPTVTRSKLTTYINSRHFQPLKTLHMHDGFHRNSSPSNFCKLQQTWNLS